MGDDRRRELRIDGAMKTGKERACLYAVLVGAILLFAAATQSWTMTGYQATVVAVGTLVMVAAGAFWVMFGEHR